MSETPVFTDLRRTFEWTCPECGSDHYDVGEVDGQILTCEGCSKTVLVRWQGLSGDGVVAEVPEYEYEVTYSSASAPSIDGYRMRRSSGILPSLAVVTEWMGFSQNPIAHRRTKAVPAGEWERIEVDQ